MSRRKSKDTGPLLSKQFLKDLEQTKPTDLPTLFAKTFDYPDHNQNLQQKCLVEFYVGAYWFGIENGLDLGQIVNLLLLVKKIIDTLSQSQSEYYNALLEEIKNGLEDFGENAAIIVAFVKTYFRL